MKLKMTLVAMATIFAILGAQAQKHSLRIMTYDVHNGIGCDKVHSYDRPAEIINKYKPDVVALQELDSITSRIPDYVLGELAERTGMYAYYGPAFNYAGGKYGVGILSKRAALSVQQYAIDCPSEPRTILIIELEECYFASTHWSMDPKERMSAVLRVRDIAATLDKPLFFGGDLNAEPDSPEIQTLKEYATILTPTDKPTWNYFLDIPPTCIDYILCSGCDVKVRKSRIIEGVKAAEHLPLLVDVKF